MKKIIIILIIFNLVISVNAQEAKFFKEMFLEAESYILFEEYNEALPLYQELSGMYPTNANYTYRLGICYLNTEGEVKNAIKYLEEAVKSINTKYKEGSFKETGASVESYYYLANAYRIDYRFNEAIRTFKKFENKYAGSNVNLDLIQDQIAACKIAKTLEMSPVYFSKESLGDVINTRYSELNPVLSGDGNAIVYSAQLPFYDALFYSKKVNGVWTEPLNLMPVLGIDEGIYPTSLSHDGKEMFVYSLDGFDGNIYSSKLVDGEWTTLVKLNENINTKYWESHATINKDGSKLYFTSNRSGTVGELDIWVSEKDENGEWGTAMNMGETINTIYNEETPFIVNDDKLFFSSYGHTNMGGYDIFSSSLQDDKTWTTPKNLGSPLNTPSNNMFFNAVEDGFHAYVSIYSDTEGEGKFDIYKIEYFNDEHPRMFSVNGKFDLKGDVDDSSKYRILVSKVGSDELVKVIPIDPKNPNFEFELPEGDYIVRFEGDNVLAYEEEIGFSSYQDKDDIEINPYLTTDFLLAGKIQIDPSLLDKKDFKDLAEYEKYKTLTTEELEALKGAVTTVSDKTAIFAIDRSTGDTISKALANLETGEYKFNLSNSGDYKFVDSNGNQVLPPPTVVENDSIDTFIGTIDVDDFLSETPYADASDKDLEFMQDIIEKLTVKSIDPKSNNTVSEVLVDPNTGVFSTSEPKGKYIYDAEIGAADKINTEELEASNSQVTTGQYKLNNDIFNSIIADVVNSNKEHQELLDQLRKKSVKKGGLSKEFDEIANNIYVVALDSLTGDTIATSVVDNVTGDYNMLLPKGVYKLVFYGDGVIPYEEYLYVSGQNADQNIIGMDVVLLPSSKNSIIDKAIFYSFDRYSLTKETRSNLDNLGELLKTHKDIKVQVIGHTCSIGTDDYNNQLGDKRAAAVVNYLVVSGVSKTRISYVSKGESAPIAVNNVKEGRKYNRRAEIKLLNSNIVLDSVSIPKNLLIK